MCRMTLNHSTNFDYNDRGQITVTTLPWINWRPLHD